MRALITRPLLLWVAYMAILALMALAAEVVWPALLAGVDGLSAQQLVLQAVLTMLPLPVAAYLGWRRIGFVRPTHLHLLVFPVAAVASGYVASVKVDTPEPVVGLPVARPH